MKKKVLALLMTAAMAASVIGCGNGAGGQAAEETAAAGEAGEAAEETAAAGEAGEEAAEEEAITCELLVWGPSEDQSEENGNWLPAMCEQFAAEHPNWNITFKYVFVQRVKQRQR